ncbi:hypothetical protein EK21DRAFT_35515, partial [Setomelanomma holmii]
MPTTAPDRRRRNQAKAFLRRKRTPFRFIDLPAELRNRIYGYVLAARHGVAVIWRTGTAREHKKPELYDNAAGLEIQHNRVSFCVYPSKHHSVTRALLVFAG